MTIDKLIRFVKEHDGCNATVDYVNPGRIVVSGWVVLPTGELVQEYQSIPATLSAVRAWLGY